MTLQCRQWPAATGVPEAHHLILSTAGQQVAVSGKSHTPDRSGVAEQGRQPPLATGVPDRHRPIDAAAGHYVSVGRHGYPMPSTSEAPEVTPLFCLPRDPPPLH